MTNIIHLPFDVTAGDDLSVSLKPTAYIGDASFDEILLLLKPRFGVAGEDRVLLEENACSSVEVIFK